MKIIADANIPYIKGVLEPFAQVVYLPGRGIGRADVAGADALLVRTRTRCDAGLLEGSRVRFIATATIGSDHIDLDYCREHGIEVATAAGSNAGGVLQWVAAVLASMSGRDGWNPQEKTIGIVGLGNVGSLIREYALAWGFGVLCCDPPREAAEGLGAAHGFVPAEELARRSDIITFHTPLTRNGPYPTAGMAGEEFLKLTRPGSVIINSARGGIVDESVLKRYIDMGHCSGCIDTWAGEPDIDRSLLEAALIATPHIAGYSAQGKANASAMTVRAVARSFGMPLQDWYPSEVVPAGRRSIGWMEMCRSIARYYDIAAETRSLKASPERFEQFREEYAYREEYF